MKARSIQLLLTLLFLLKNINTITEWTISKACISEELFNYIKKTVPTGKTILELGSGWSSGQISKFYTLYSIENNEKWLNKYPTNYIHAPIVDGWYDTETLAKELPSNYELILIDGPTGKIGRQKFFDNLDLFNTNIIMIFDDVNRIEEYNLLEQVAQKLNKKFTVHTDSFGKKFGVIDNRIKLEWAYEDFETSMQKEDPLHYQNFFEKNNSQVDNALTNCPFTNQDVLNIFKTIYEENNISVKKSKPCQKIPKIIHQIWLGRKLPEQYKAFQETWLENHPDWEYKLWTDKDVETFNMQNREYFDNAKNFAAKANILRYEILYQFGGLYVDSDFECYKSFDILNENYEFYCGIFLRNNLGINNALIGSIPGHPILQYCINHLDDSAYHNKQKSQSGPYYLTSAFLNIISTCDKKTYNNIIALPCSYFYPLIWQSYESVPQKYPESFAIHYWYADWKGIKFKHTDQPKPEHKNPIGVYVTKLTKKQQKKFKKMQKRINRHNRKKARH